MPLETGMSEYSPKHSKHWFSKDYVVQWLPKTNYYTLFKNETPKKHLATYYRFQDIKPYIDGEKWV